MSFATPGWLPFALLLCVASVLVYRALSRRKGAQVLQYTSMSFLREAARPPVWPERLLLGALVLAAALLGSAPAGPHLTTLVPAKDGTAILCIDTSGSMSAQDVTPTRSDASKAAARRFIEQVPAGTKVGIIAFSTGAAVVEPPTGEKTAALDALDRIPLPNGATAIGDALALAAQQLPDKGHRVVILITDGVNNRGVDPMEAAKFLASRHVPVYTVGIGTNDSGQLIPGTTEPATIDEDALGAIAQAGGGSYARADSATQLQNALSQLGRTTVLEKKKIDASFPFAIAGGFLLLLTIFGGLAAGRLP